MAAVQSPDPNPSASQGRSPSGSLDPGELLEAWERGISQTPGRRALTLLEATSSDVEREGLAELTVGNRDRRLLTTRELLFGSRIVALAECPACGAELELDFALDEVTTADTGGSEIQLELDGRSATVRLPTAGDLADAGDAGDPDSARLLLLQRCLTPAGASTGQHVTAAGHHGGSLSPDVALAVDRAIAAADPQADVRLSLSCSECEEEWLAPFDIASFLWTEVDDWAVRALREVHHLASAYGWSEDEVLALSPTRRRFYMAAVET